MNHFGPTPPTQLRDPHDCVRQGSPKLTDARLRVAGAALLDHSLAHAVLRLAGAIAHLDSATALLAALGPAAPRAPALCGEERGKQGKEWLMSASGTLSYAPFHMHRH